jgi:hypothetical protein
MKGRQNALYEEVAGKLDHLIRAGESLPVDRSGLVLISALEDSAYALSGGKSHPLGSEWSFMPAFRRVVRRLEAVKKAF